MNISEDGLNLEAIKKKQKKNKSENSSLAEKQEELQDTTARGRRLDFWDQPIENCR
jgi:hypothetical protein